MTATRCRSCPPSLRVSRPAAPAVAPSPSTTPMRSPARTTTACTSTAASSPRPLPPTTVASGASPSPQGAPTGSLVLDTVDNNGTFTVDAAAGTMSGWVDNGSGLSVGRSRMFVHGMFDRAATATGVAPYGHTGTRYAKFDTTTDRDVELRLATSFISLDQAKRNHGLELAGRTFNDVQGDAKAKWDERLNVVEVEGASDAETRTLYSNLYRLNLYPNSQFENTGTASPLATSTRARSRRSPAAPPPTTTNAPSRTARSTSTTASGTPTGPCGRPTRCSTRRWPPRSLTASSSSTATVAGSPVGPHRATPTS